MKMRAVPGARLRYRGAFCLWLTLAALPAAAQVSPLTSQSLFFNQASNAYPGNYLAAEAGLLYTNNASYTANGSGDTLASLGLSGDTRQQGTRLDYHLDADIALLKYFHGTFPTEPSGYLDGEAAFKIVPGVFSWIARETYTQVQIDPFAAITPTNLENVNYITTGPRFTLRPTLRTSVRLEGLYSYVSSNSPSADYVNIDSQRYGGNLKVDRAFSSTSSVYIKGSYEKVDFKDQLENNNFSVADALAGFHLQGGRTDLDISAGYTKLRVEDVVVPVDTIIGVVERPETQTFGGATWGFDLSRLITPSQRVSLYAAQQFTDAAAAFRLSFDQAVPTIAPAQIAAGDPFQNRNFGADWRFETVRTTLNVSFMDSRQRYVVNSSNNRDLKIASAVFARQLSPVLNWDVGVSFQHSDYVNTQSSTNPTGTPTNPTGTLNATGVVTDLRWRVGERLGLRFLYAHTIQYSVSVNQVGIIASYALTGATLPDTTQPESPGLQPVSPESMQSSPQ
jgi:hypothetical protein